MLRSVAFAVFVVLAACSTKSAVGFGPCPQPTPQPQCVDRGLAWCSTTSRGTPDAIGDAGVQVSCHDPSGADLVAIFPDAGPLDDGGVPLGCPAIPMLPTDGSQSVTDAGVQSGSSCCYPTHVLCVEGG